MALNLDIAALRTLVAGVELGSFARAADQVGRSTSAVSLLLAYARRILALNDEAAAAVRGVDLSGGVRLGLQEEFGEVTLPEVLGRFARAHPKIRVEAMVARNQDLWAGVLARKLDLALVWGSAGASAVGDLATAGTAGAVSTRVAEPELCWIGAAGQRWRIEPGEPVPLAAFDRPCPFHDAATGALDRAGIPWRVSFTSPNLGGLWAAAAAGLGLVVRTPYGLPGTLRPLGAGEGLPPLGTMPLMLLRAPGPTSEVAQRLADIMLEALRRD